MSKKKKIKEIIEQHKEVLQSLASYDITFCSNGECPLKKTCHRSLDNLTVNPGRHLSVSHFEPVNGLCQYYWDRRK